MKRSITVLGALGTGTFAPLLAEERWPGGSRRVVLARPAPEAASVVSGCDSDQVVGEQGRIRLDGREYGIFAYAPGVDVGQLLDLRCPDGFGPRAVVELERGISAALEASPVPHGDLGASSIRVDGTGRVRLVGFTGREADDRARVRELLAEWSGGDGSASLADLVGDLQIPPAPHALLGRAVEDAPPPAVPPKARTAAFAAVTLILGLLTAWFYASG